LKAVFVRKRLYSLELAAEKLAAMNEVQRNGLQTMCGEPLREELRVGAESTECNVME